MAAFDKIYLGKIEDIDDPLKIGRCKVRVEFLFGSEIKTSELPWAYPAYSCMFGGDSQSGAISIPKVGSIVHVKFDNGDIYSPIYSAIQELSSEVKTFLRNNYEGTHILLYDNGTKIYYVPKSGIRIENDESFVNVYPEGRIEISTKNDDSLIELDRSIITINANNEINTCAINQIHELSESIWVEGKNTSIGSKPIYSAVCGQPLMLLLTAMASVIDAKNPRSLGVCTNIVNTYKSMILSDTVKVSH